MKRLTFFKKQSAISNEVVLKSSNPKGYLLPFSPIYAKLTESLMVEEYVGVYQIIYQFHAVKRMIQRRVREEDVERVLLTGEIIEVYPDDTPYPSVLLLGWSNDRPFHVVVATDSVNQRKIVITIYVPGINRWEIDFRERRK